MALTKPPGDRLKVTFPPFRSARKGNRLLTTTNRSETAAVPPRFLDRGARSMSCKLTHLRAGGTAVWRVIRFWYTGKRPTSRGEKSYGNPPDAPLACGA